MGVLVSLVSSRPSLMIIASASRFHVYLPWHSVFIVSWMWSRFQPGEAPSFSVIMNLWMDLRFKLYSAAASLHNAGSCRHPPAAIRASLCRGHCWLLTIIFIISLPALRFMRDFLQFSTSQQQPGYLLRSDNSVQLSSVATALFSEDIG